MPLKRPFFRIFIILVILLYGSFLSRASHLVGGDISVEWTGVGNNFEITVNVYRDCLNAMSGAFLDRPSIRLGLYDLQTHGMNKSIDVPLVDSTLLFIGDSCNSFSQLCVQQGIYRVTTTINNNPNGYYLSWLRCCRNDIINNITAPGSTGMVLYVEIPDPVLQNSTPIFGGYPNAYMCVGQENIKDFSAIDSNDGDSLVYSLVTAYNGYGYNGGAVPIPPPPKPAPYPLVTWEPPYNASDMIGGSPVMSIDPQTGVLKAYPDTTDNGKVFVFVVRVEEYNKVTKEKLGEIRRDMQYIILPCNSDIAPEITFPTVNSYNIFAGDSLCFNVRLEDPNSNDSVFLHFSEQFSNLPGKPLITFSSAKGIKSIENTFCIQTFCDNIREAPYQIILNGNDSSCYGKNFTYKTIDFYVYTLDGTLTDPVPNVFTPNNDGINDVIKVNATVNNCYDKFSIKIYDRWGDKVFESTDFLFTWDGTHYKTGQKLSERVFFYVIKGSFMDQEITRKGHITSLN